MATPSARHQLYLPAELSAALEKYARSLDVPVTVPMLVRAWVEKMAKEKKIYKPK